MGIDWKRKLTSRKFWAAVCGFVSMVVLALGKDASQAETITGMIMAAGSLIAYIIGEGLADGNRVADTGNTIPVAADKNVESNENECEECYLHYDDND